MASTASGNMEPDLFTLTLYSALQALRRGDFSSLELTQACLRQVERLDPSINAFITPTPELAVQAALQADALHSLHPSNLNDLALLGIPVALKDLFETQGVRTTAGSKFFADNIPAEDAEAVRRVKLAGAVILGKTNTHEFALGVTGVNPHYGAVKNPSNFLASRAGPPVVQLQPSHPGCAWLPWDRILGDPSVFRLPFAVWSA